MKSKLIKELALFIAVTICLLLGATYLSWAFNADAVTRMEFIKTIPVIIIGLIAAGIALRQYQTAKAKLNLDLFEKRYEIFELTRKELIDSFTDKKTFNPEFLNSVPKSLFLFGSEIQNYLEQIIQQKGTLLSITSKSERDMPLTAKDENRFFTSAQWLTNELEVGATEKFGKYMNFEEWK